MRYPIPHEGDPTAAFVGDVVQLLVAHGYPQPDTDDLPRLAQTLATFLHGQPITGRVIHVLTGETGTASGKASIPYAGHALISGGTYAETAAALTTLAQMHLANNGVLWLHLHRGADPATWQAGVPFADWTTVADTLPEQIVTMQKMISTRAADRLNLDRALPPVLLVIDDLRELAADPTAVTDLVSVLRTGHTANVWIAAGVEHVDLLPTSLAEAFKTYASITDVRDMPR